MNMRMRAGTITSSLLLLLLVLSQTSACGQVAGQPVAQGDTVNAKLLCGNWQGSWVSCKSGHNGRLRATFCRISKTKVQAKFTGSFCKVFPFRYKAVLDIVHEEDGLIDPPVTAWCWEPFSGALFSAVGTCAWPSDFQLPCS